MALTLTENKVRKLKTAISPMFLTYFMVRWEEIEQSGTDQKCTICRGPLKRTEVFTDENGVGYVGYVCHADKQVTWLRGEGS